MSLTRTVATVGTHQRDLYLDFLRVVSVGGIVVGHWLGATVWRYGGRVGVNSIIDDIPGFAPATWLLMTVPVLFFVGGYANSEMITAHRRAGLPVRTFLARRARRLLLPVAFFIGVWVCVQVVLHILDLGGELLIRGVSVGGVMPFAPLWFIAIYLAVVGLTPITHELHAHAGAIVPAGLVCGAVAVDVLRFAAHVPYIGWLNLLLVWLLPHQLGYFYADGRLTGQRRHVPAGLCVVGLAALVLATTVGGYPASIGGVPGDPFSNMNPPTIVIVALSLWLIGLVLLVAEQVRRSLRSAAVSRTVTRLNSMTMSVYLWHMTALLIVFAILEPFGLAQGGASLTTWLIERPIWLALGGVVLTAITTAVAPVERIR